jgi:hypothetical protein
VRPPLFVLMVSLLAASVPVLAMGSSPAPGKFKQTAPVINDVTIAYQFRTRIKTDLTCTRFASEADNAFLSSTLEDAQKALALKALGAQAAAAGCLLPE